MSSSLDGEGKVEKGIVYVNMWGERMYIKMFKMCVTLKVYIA